MSKFIDLTGDKYGKLTVLHRGKNSSRGATTWECSCTCGKFSNALSINLRSGATKSCGCNQLKMLKDRKIHGMSESPMYALYQRLKSKGLCEEWRGAKGFLTFIDDVGKRPGKNFKFTRLNKNLDFCKNNFEWVSSKKFYKTFFQAKLVCCFGEQTTIAQACKDYGINRTTVIMRMKTGLSLEDALTKPVKIQRRKS